MKLYDIVVVGATGMVGRKILQILEERNFPVDRVIAVGSSKSKGTEILFKNRMLRVCELDESVFVHAEIAFFAAGSEVSKKWVPFAARHCRIVVDNSSEFRMHENVPLVVPEVNPRDIFMYKSHIIANPNCSTIQMVVALKPLHDAFRIKRIVVATYQAVSGAGHRGISQLVHEMNGKAVEHPAFPHRIASNVIPQIAVIFSDGLSKEEYKMIDETQKIFHDRSVKVSPTCVRVPVLNCHSEAVNVEFEQPFEMSQVRKLLSTAKGVVLMDDLDEGSYPTVLDVDDRDEVFVGRLRRDESVQNGLSMWIVADNLRKGAATNAVQIVEAWVKGPAAHRVHVPAF